MKREYQESQEKAECGVKKDFLSFGVKTQEAKNVKKKSFAKICEIFF